MSDLAAAWVVIGVAGAGTFAIRASFLVFAGRMGALPRRAREALRMIPPAALAALVAPALLRPAEDLDPLNPRLLAGLVALAVAVRTRNMLPTISVGIVAVVLLERVPALA